MRFLSCLLACSALAAVSTPSAASAAVSFTDFAASPGAYDVALGADANVWFTDFANPGALGRLTQAGVATSFTTGVTSDGKPAGITAGPGGLWFTENARDKLGRITTAGVVTEFPDGPHNSPLGIAAGPDGNLWYTATGNRGAIARITPAGVVTEYTVGLTQDGAPREIALGPDRNLWFTLPGTRRVGRITPQGVITEFGAGVLTGTPLGIAAGPDGNLWFTQSGTVASIGRITPSGALTQFTSGLPTGSAPVSIAAGPDDDMYFTDGGTDTVGQITTAGVISQYGPALATGAAPRGITAGGDGRLWFAQQGRARVGRLSVAPAAGAVTASAVTSTAATVASTVRPNSEPTTYVFEHGTTTAYGQSTAGASVGSGTAAQPATASLTGLSPSTTYHVRVVATNATGTTYGADQAFATAAPGAPSATSLPASDITATAGTLNATVNPQNASTGYHFDWGSDTTYGAQVPATDIVVGATGSDSAVTQSLADLQPNTTYHYRVVATSASGTTAGADRSFATDAPLADATTSPAANVTASGATLAGVIDAQNSATTYAFEIGPTTAYGARTPAADESAGADHTARGVTQDAAGLEPGTTYHFRLVATNNTGVATGGDQSFTTADLPPAPLSPTPTSPTPTPVPGPSVPAPMPMPLPLTGLTAPIPVPAAAPRPVLGRTAVAEVVRGTVRVRVPGRTAFATLRADAGIPSGSLVDTRTGTVDLVSVVNRRGRTQRARFHGATFRMALSRADSGWVDVTLAQAPTGCRSRRFLARAATTAKAPIRLWSKDRNGRYRTHGRNSVATVRGTVWTTTESCDGTLTRVLSGSVVVRDRRSGRSTVVRAGGAHLARARA